MSLRVSGLGEIPAETERVARAVCPGGSLAMRLRDEFADVFSGEVFASLFPRRGRPAVPPGALALVTVLQFAEGLSDRQLASAVRVRIDWRYALGLELTDTGFDYSVLSEFRARLVEGRVADELFEQVLRAAKERGLLKTSGRARTDSARVLAAIRAVNHLEMIGETLRAALNALAVVFPRWLAAEADEDWFDRYGHRVWRKQGCPRARRSAKRGSSRPGPTECAFWKRPSPGGLRARRGRWRRLNCCGTSGSRTSRSSTVMSASGTRRIASGPATAVLAV